MDLDHQLTVVSTIAARQWQACHRKRSIECCDVQMAKITSVFPEQEFCTDPTLVTLAELLESQGLRQQLTPDEFEWAVEKLGPAFDAVSPGIMRKATTHHMDIDHSLELWTEGVTRAWKKTACPRPLRDVVQDSIEIDAFQIRPEFEEFMRRCDYTASVRGQTATQMRAMEEALVDFVAKAAEAKMKF